MGLYTAREIYRFARLAGFSPDQAVTMTAIALAESGGHTGAHATHGEDSRGLWQINVAAHGDWAARRNLYDPVENARAAFKVSGGGQDVSPWTTTHGTHAKYLAFRAQAQAAAAASGDPTAVGVWTGTPGYGHPLAAGGGSGGGESGSAHRFLEAALAQSGDRYVFGAEARLNDPNPTTFDCSELVQWAAHQAGVEMPDGSFAQYLELKQQGALIDVEKAISTPGALLFSFSEEPTPGGGRPSQAHVAISLGDGRTIEARGRNYGVGSWSAKGRFQYAAVVPGLSGADGGGSVPTTALAAFTADAGGGLDTDHDGLTDAMETRLGLDPTRADTDSDGASDGYELLKLHSDPLKADTDGDGVADGIEGVLGTSPVDPDSDRDGRLDGANRTAPPVDRDHDGLDDDLERLLHSKVDQLDSDGDGFTDGAEYQAFFDPTDPANNPLSGNPLSGNSLSGSGTSVTGGGRSPATDVAHHDPHAWGLDDLPA